jgi:hypothetical protein
MLRPSHPPLFDHRNNALWSVQVMKLLIMQSSPAYRQFFPFIPIFSSGPCSQTFSIYAPP